MKHTLYDRGVLFGASLLMFTYLLGFETESYYVVLACLEITM